MSEKPACRICGNRERAAMRGGLCKRCQLHPTLGAWVAARIAEYAALAAARKPLFAQRYRIH